MFEGSGSEVFNRTDRGKNASTTTSRAGTLLEFLTISWAHAFLADVHFTAGFPAERDVRL